MTKRNSGVRTAANSLMILVLTAAMLLISSRSASAATCTLPMEVSPPSGVPGTSITISGAGFEPLTLVEVYFASTFLEAVYVDFGGLWTVNAVVPELNPGTYPLRYAADPIPANAPMFFCDEPDFTVFALLVVNPSVTQPQQVPPGAITPITQTPPPTAAAPPPTAPEATTTTTTTTTVTTPEATTTTVTTDSSLVAAAGEDTEGTGGTLIGVLIGLVLAVTLGGAWLLGRRTAPAGYPPPAPPYRGSADDGEYDDRGGGTAR